MMMSKSDYMKPARISFILKTYDTTSDPFISTQITVGTDS